MKHPVVLLEDEVQAQGEPTKRVIEHFDRYADVKIVGEVSDAKKEIDEHTDFAYVIVDLFLDHRASHESGCDFVKFVLTREKISKLPILILSAVLPQYEDEIKEFGKPIRTIKRTTNREKWILPLSEFIEEALLNYKGDG